MLYIPRYSTGCKAFHKELQGGQHTYSRRGDVAPREEPGSRAVAWIGSCGWHFFGIDKRVLDVAPSQ